METSLKNVLAGKVQAEITRRNANAQQAFSNMEATYNALKDFIVSGSMLHFKKDGNTLLGDLGSVQFSIHRNALNQFTAQNNIPLQYLTRLLSSEDWGGELAVEILNRHSDNSKRERTLLRAVGNDLRGVLSDQYRRLDGMEIIQNIFRAATAHGAVLLDAHASDTQTFVEFLHPQLYDIETPHNGTVTVAIGFRYKNSDFGDGALSLDAYEMQAVCLNGQVTQRLFREIHLGTKLPTDLRLSEETYRLDTKRSASLLNDAVNTLYLPETIEKRFDTIRAASGKIIDLKPRIEELPKIGFTNSEKDAVEAVLMRSNPEDGVVGEPTLWKFAQAIGAVARDAEPQRRRDLEQFAGAVLSPVDKEIEKMELVLN